MNYYVDSYDYKNNELTEFWSLSHNVTYNINENGIIPRLVWR